MLSGLNSMFGNLFDSNSEKNRDRSASGQSRRPGRGSRRRFLSRQHSLSAPRITEVLEQRLLLTAGDFKSWMNKFNGHQVTRRRRKAAASLQVPQMELLEDRALLSVTSLGGDVLVNNSFSNDQQDSDIGTAADGSQVIVWESNHLPGGDFDVFFQRYDATGAKVGPEVQVNATDTNDQQNPRIAVASDGRFAVTWQSDADTAGNQEVFVRVYNADGTPLSTELRVNAASVQPLDQYNPVVAMQADGSSLVVAYQDDTGGDSDIMFQQFTITDGTVAKAGTPVEVNSSNDARPQSVPDIAMAENGDFTIVWQHQFDPFPGIDEDIHYQRFAADRTPKDAAAVAVFDSGAQNEQRPAIDVDLSGDIIIVAETQPANLTVSASSAPGTNFDETAPITDTISISAPLRQVTDVNVTLNITHPRPDEIRATLTSPNGKEVQLFTFNDLDMGGNLVNTVLDQDAAAEITTGASPYTGTFRPAGGGNLDDFNGEFANGNWTLTLSDDAFGDDGTLVSWTLNITTTPDVDIIGQRRNASGVVQGNPRFTVNTNTAGDQSRPDVSIQPDGDFVVVWQSEMQDGDGIGVFGQRYNKTGGPFRSEFLVNSVTANNQTDPRVALAATGKLGVTFTNDNSRDGSQAGVYARAFMLSAPPQGPTVSLPGSQATADEQVNTFTANDQKNASVAINDSGAHVVVWESDTQTPDGDGFGIFVQQYDAAGAKVGAEIPVNVTTTRGQKNADIAIANNGTFVVVWDSDHTTAGNQEVYARVYAADGTHITGELHVNSDVANEASDQKNPQIAIHPDGTSFVVVYENDNGTSVTDVFAQRFTISAGTTVAKAGAPVAVNTPIAGFAFNRPDIAIAPNGITVVTWVGNGGANADVFAQRFQAEFTPMGDQLTVAGTAADEEDATVAIDGNGNFVVAYESTALGNRNVFAQRFTATGVPQGGPILVNTETEGDQLTGGTTATGAKKSIGIDAAGNFTIVWESPNQDGAGNGVFGQQFNTTGGQRGAEFLVNRQTTGDQDSPGIAMNSSGAFAVVWESADADGVGVFIQRYSNEIVPFEIGSLDTADQLVNTATNNSQSNSAVDVNASGAYVAVWESQGQDGAGLGIYFQRYSGGAKAGAETRANVGTAGDQKNADVAVADNGVFVVTWQDGANIEAGVFNADGTPFDAAGDITVDTGATPRVEIADDGASFVIVYSKTSNIFMRRYTIAGTTVTPAAAEQVNMTINAGQQDQPDIGMAANGRFVITWEDDFSGHAVHRRYLANGDADGDETVALVNVTNVSVAVSNNGHIVAADKGFDLFAQRFNAAGDAQGGVIQLNTETEGTQENGGTELTGARHSVAMDTAGNFVAVWQSNNQDGDQMGVFAQRFNHTGAAVGPEFQVSDTSSDNQQFAEVSMNATGVFQIVFENDNARDGSQTGVYKRSFSGPNAAPVVSGLPAVTVTYTEGDGAKPIAAAATVSDADGDNIQSMTISLTNAVVADGEVIDVTPSDGITRDAASTTTNLILTGSATADAYQTVLRTLVYNNPSENPTDEPDRTVTVVVQDTNGANSAVQTITIDVVPVPNPPIVDLNGAAAGTGFTVQFGGAATAIVDSAALTVTDVDSANLVSATATITNFQTGDSLAVMDSDGITSALVDGVLTLTGSATPAAYQTVLRTLTFNTTSTNTTTRTIEVKANDGDGADGTAAVATVTFGTAPVVDLNGAGDGVNSTSTYNTTTGGAQAIADATATVTDADAGDMIQSMTITITTGSQTGDVLAVTNSGGITGAFAGNVLTLSGTAAPAAYETVLRTLTFTATSSDTTARVITVQATDVSGNASNAATITVNIVDAPPTAVLDLDGSGGNASAQSDGLLVFAALAGVTNESQLSQLLSPSATKTVAEVLASVAALRDSLILDVDGNGVVSAQSDGLLIFAVLAGVTNEAQLAGLIAPGAPNSPAQVVAAVNALRSPAAGASSAAASAQVLAAVHAADDQSPVRDDSDRFVSLAIAELSRQRNVFDAGNGVVSPVSPPAVGTTLAFQGTAAISADSDLELLDGYFNGLLEEDELLLFA